ncbi:MAG: DEAD/DEAH box helicase, partial [Acidimicrobiales bacterium]
LRDSLRAQGRVSITAADVATVLQAHPGRFRVDISVPPRWWSVNGCGDNGDNGDNGGNGATGATTTNRLPPLYAWQVEAMGAWLGRGGRGVIEAVTGTGKTMVGIAAAAQELARGGQVCVLVPTAELLRQWQVALARHLPPGATIGLLGAGHHDRMGNDDVLVAIVNSARDAELRPRRPGGLLIGDECHRYGTDMNRAALEAGFTRRLGLSATFERADDGHLAWLMPYFGRTCFRMGYRRAIADGVAAHFVVALVGVDFDEDERATYDDLSLELARARAILITRFGVPAEPIGVFLRTTSMLARSHGHSPAGTAARGYLRAMADRRRLLAETPAKTATLDSLVPALRAAKRAIVFTQTIQSSERAAKALRQAGLGAAAIHSGLDGAARLSVLAAFHDGHLQVVTAPQVLDEGVDVPAADLAVIVASSRSRRQMIQRMGRVLRPKPDGRRARFVVVHVRGTVEDPALGAHEDFLDEVTGVADRVRSFRSCPSEADELNSFLCLSS